MTDDEPHRAALVFSAPVVKDLVSDKVRLPPNYVGVRRVRPSSFQVRDEFCGKSACDVVPKTKIVYKITDANGNERRMNSQEKKKHKMQLKKERAEEWKRLKMERDAADAQNENNGEPPIPSAPLPFQDATSTNGKKYHQLDVNKSSLEEELADLRGDRDGVPPVMLSPPLARQVLQSGILATRDHVVSEQPQPVLDDDLATRWAEALKISMKSAEEARCNEDMRPMPYTLVPEVWTRLRPESLTTKAEPTRQPPPEAAAESSEMWSFAKVRRKRGQVDIDTDIVVSLLHRQSRLHISCGAKFGCDFLLYDGRRDQRHAFAGLRIIGRQSTSQLPVPTPYDLTGYVRCLNTAGKLALLATVETDGLGVRVAIVDLALEKILSQNKRKRSRQDAGKNLTKHR